MALAPILRNDYRMSSEERTLGGGVGAGTVRDRIGLVARGTGTSTMSRAPDAVAGAATIQLRPAECQRVRGP